MNYYFVAALFGSYTGMSRILAFVIETGIVISISRIYFNSKLSQLS